MYFLNMVQVAGILSQKIQIDSRFTNMLNLFCMIYNQSESNSFMYV